VNRSAVLSAAALCAVLVAGCSGTDTDSTVAAPSPTPSSSLDVWRFHPSIANNIDPRKVVTQDEAEKLLGKSMPHADVYDSDPNAKEFPTNTRRVFYSNRKGADFTYEATAYLTVTTMVVDNSLNQTGWTYGRNDCDVPAWGSSGVYLLGLDPTDVGLPASSTAEVNLAVHGVVDSKHYYPNPTQHDLAHPYGVYIWGDQKLGNGKTRPVRLTIKSEGNPSNRKDLMNLAAKAVARMNLK